MPVELDLADIQGNILTGYGRVGFPKGRIMLFHIDNGDSGRRFVTELLRLITTALRWPSSRAIPTGKTLVPRPDVTVNIAITFHGLAVLGLPTRTLRGMPDEFMDGMAKRAPLLGDDFAGPDWKDSWDEVWRSGGQDGGTDRDHVHILISLFAQMNADGFASAHLTQERERSKGFAANWAACGSCPVTIEMASRHSLSKICRRSLTAGPTARPQRITKNILVSTTV
jgi:hypothetical protein